MAARVRRARSLDGVAIVTSTDPSDVPLVQAAERAGLPVFRGSLDDVLARFCAAADAYRPDVIVRLTGDCPLADPAVIDMVVSARAAGNVDYASNIEPASYPDGLDVECFTREALDRAKAEATLPSQREHVTPWMRSEEAGLARVNVRAVADFSNIRLTVDYPDDLAVIRRIVELQGQGSHLDLFDILRIVSANPGLLAFNRHDRNEGLAKSLADDRSLSGAKP
jgi:spore coat polysaccharide biosynthesis protein SpsF (cytidylyltransferase family)